jgi:hypothetical protein
MLRRFLAGIALLSIALTALIGGMIGAVRAAQNEYACLRFYYNARQNWVLDLNSGVYLHDRRLTGSPLDIRRGAVSPDGLHVAYVNQAYTGRYSLYVQPNDLPVSRNTPSFCTDLMTCWRSQPPSATAQRLQLNTPVIGMGWTPDSKVLGYVWLVRSGVIRAAANAPDGTPIAARDLTGEYLYFHGWAAQGRYLLFSTQDSALRLTLHFWSPLDNSLRSYALGAARGVPPYITFSIAPKVGRAAAVIAGRDGVPMLYVVSAEDGIARRESLPPHIDWRFNWSPMGNAVGLYHFDPPYWHFSIYEVTGGTHRTIGGVTTGSVMHRDGLRPFFWAADGESAAFVQPNRDETGKLVRYRLADRQIAPIREAILSAYEAPAQGRVAVVRRANARTALEVIDVLSGDVQRVAEREMIRDVLWLRGADALSFVAQADGALAVEYADLTRGTVQTLVRAERLYETPRQEPATDFLTLWWRAADGQTYLDAYTPQGERVYRYRLLGKRSSRPPILFTAADWRAAVIMFNDEDGAEYLQIARSDGERAAMIDSDERRSTTALWSPDGERVAIVTSPLSNAPDTARQRLRVLASDGTLHYDFQAITVGLLYAWTRCTAQ